jgi:hypothetical protein
LTTGNNVDRFEKERDILFLSAMYKRHGVERREVDKITTEEKQSAKILITISVMDNGISLKDEKLRNIIIMSDTEEEFIQMIGRKRAVDKEFVNLYIVSKTREEINRRFLDIKRTETKLDYYIKDINNFNKNLSRGYIMDFNTQDGKNYYNRLSRIEIEMIERHQKSTMQSLLVDRDDTVQKFLYPILDYSMVNLLAVDRINYLVTYYRELLEELKKDDMALLRHQLRWLNKSEKEIEGLVREKKIDVREQYKKSIIEAFQSFMRIGMIFYNI